MIKQCVVLAVSEDGKTATVSPLITGHCISCTEKCASRGTPFEAENDTGLQIEKGSLVILGTSKEQEAVQSIVSILIPMAVSVSAYIASTPVMENIFHKTATEGAKAFFVLCGLMISCAAVLCVSRNKIRPVKPKIISIC